MKISTSTAIFILLASVQCLAQNRDGNVPVCDPKTTKISAPFEILDNTQNPDLIPYVSKFVVRRVRENWYNLIPPDAMPPLLKQGCVAIDFSILKDGTVAGIGYFASSGSLPMDRAAYGGIIASSPFPPLPEGAKTQLRLRFKFFYNPEGVPRSSGQGSPVQLASGPLPTPELVRNGPDLSPARVLHIVEPEYPKQARKKKIQGSVVLKASIDQTGRVTGVAVVSGDPMLTQVVAEAVKIWTFEPFTKSGRVVNVQQQLTINFSLNWATGELDSTLPPATVVEQ